MNWAEHLILLHRMTGRVEFVFSGNQGVRYWPGATSLGIKNWHVVGKGRLTDEGLNAFLAGRTLEQVL